MPNLNKAYRRNSFENLFPEIIYDPDQVAEVSLDIWSAFESYSLPIGFDESLYQDYRLSSGDTLESIAYKVYGNVRLWWLIPLANDVEDPFDFLENVLQADDYVNNTIKVYDPNYLPDIISEIQQQSRRETIDFRRSQRK
jgi:hypothetical protein